MKAYKPLNKSELRSTLMKESERLRKGNFENHLYLTAYVLGEFFYWTDVQIQDFLNRLLNQYDCLIAGSIDINDFIDHCWEEYGFRFVNGNIDVRKTANDIALEDERLADE